MGIPSLCTPAMIYFVISIIYLIINIFTNFNIMSMVIRLLVILVWTWLLNFLCTKGFTVISWLLIIVPFLMSF